MENRDPESMDEKCFTSCQSIDSPFKEIHNNNNFLMETIQDGVGANLSFKMNELRKPSSPEKMSQIYKKIDFEESKINNNYSDDSDNETEDIDFLKWVGEQTINEAFAKTIQKQVISESVNEESKFEENKYEEQKFSAMQSEDDDLDDRIIEEQDVDEYINKSKKQKYYIKKLVKLEKMKVEGVTPGNYVEEVKSKVSSKKSKILEEAARKFYASPNNCRNFCIEKGIIDYSAKHFAQLLYCTNFEIIKKAAYLFDTKDKFAISVAEYFVRCFDFKDASLKEFLLKIHSKISAPWDAHKKTQFYEAFCEEYCRQNSHKLVDVENVMFMLSTVFFLMADQKSKIGIGGIKLDTYLSYVENQGDEFVSKAEAEKFYAEIKSGDFLPNSALLMIGVDGMYQHMKNIDYLRDNMRIYPKSTPGDLFYYDRWGFQKLQYHKVNITEKEICLSKDDKKLYWYKKGTSDKKSLPVKDIKEVQIGMTHTFKQYLKYEIFTNLLQNPNLCISIITKARSYDFYGEKESDVARWYDRLKNIANDNVSREDFALKQVEPSLHELDYDHIKQSIWESHILPNFSRYYETSISYKPVNYDKIRVDYETYKVNKAGKLKSEPTKVMKELSFPEFILTGIPILIRNIIYPVIIKNTYNESYYNRLEKKALIKMNKDKSKKKIKKYAKSIDKVFSGIEKQLDKDKVNTEYVKTRLIQMLFILFEIERPELCFSGNDIVKICLHFVYFIASNYECYKCFATFVINNQFLMTNLQKIQLEEKDIFSTMEMNTIGVKKIVSKSASDSDTYFIYNKLQNDFKDWGITVLNNLEKYNIKPKEYINSLRMSFFTNILPMSITSLIFDNYIVEGEYALVKVILAFLKLKWSMVHVVDTDQITASMLYKTIKELDLKKEDRVREYYQLKKEYKSKIDMTRILMSF